MAPHTRTPSSSPNLTTNTLARLLEALRARPGGARPDLEALEIEIERADVVKPADIPPNVVTMNSRVELFDLDTEERLCVTVVFPGIADVKSGPSRCLAPRGSRCSAVERPTKVEWPTPSRTSAAPDRAHRLSARGVGSASICEPSA